MIHQSRKHSKKREAILELLRSTKEHPSAEWIYNQLKPVYPDLSLGTVYRNLSIFRETGEIISVATVAGQERFDHEVHAHPHFICSNCHKILDLDLAFSAQDHYSDIEQSIGGHVDTESVTFMGICSECVNERV